MRILFLFLDFGSFLIISAAVLFLRTLNFDLFFFTKNCFVLIPAFIIITLVLLIFSFYDLNRLHKIDYKNLAAASIFTFLFASTIIYFLAPVFKLVTPKTNLIVIFIFYYMYIIFSRKIYLELLKEKTNVVLIGKSRTLSRLEKELTISPYYQIAGIFDKYSDHLPKGTNLIIISNDLLSTDNKILNAIFENFLTKNIEIKTDFIFFEDFLHRTPIEGIKNTIWLFQSITTNCINNIIYTIIKRFFDIFIAAIIFIILSPTMIIIYFMIKIIDKFTPVFSQKRIGKNGKTIYIHKFRTMVPDTEKTTKLGKILRRFSLDEFPQLINILKGEMSFIGPRPLLPEYLKLYSSGQMRRHEVLPGITGYAQIKGRNILSWEQKFEYDIYYIQNIGFIMDLKILVKTIINVFKRIGVNNSDYLTMNKFSGNSSEKFRDSDENISICDAAQ